MQVHTADKVGLKNKKTFLFNCLKNLVDSALSFPLDSKCDGTPKSIVLQCADAAIHFRKQLLCNVISCQDFHQNTDTLSFNQLLALSSTNCLAPSMIWKYYRWGSVRERYGAFPDLGPLAEESATKLKGGQINVCTVYVYSVWCNLFPPVAEICARLAGNFCQYLTTVTSVANSMVWVIVCYFSAS